MRSGHLRVASWFFVGTRLLMVLLTVSSFLVVLVRADYSISLGTVISVDIKARLQQALPVQNASEVRVFNRVPAFSLALKDDNASVLTRQINDAITAKSPNGKASQVSLAVVSNGTKVDYELTFKVDGVSRIMSGIEHANLAWRSFIIPDDVIAGTYSINKLVPTYVGSSITLLANALSSGTSGRVELSWYLDDRSVASTRIPTIVPQLRLFSFTSLSRPLTGWSVTVDPVRAVTMWQMKTGFNLTFIHTISESAGVAFTIARNVVYDVRAAVEAPGISSAGADEVLFETSAAYPTTELMAAIVGTSALFFVAMSVLERRYNRPRQSRTGRKRKA